MNLEYYSNLAFVTSVVVYALAMLAHAAEWATARKVDADFSAEEAPEPVLAGVGAGESAPSDPGRHREKAPKRQRARLTEPVGGASTSSAESASR